MTIEEVTAEISRLSGNNPEFYKSLIPDASPISGVRIPELRKLAKKIAKEDYKAFLDTNPLDTYEMETLHAFVIGYASDDIEIILKYFQEFIPKVHDWAVSDSLCQSFKIARKHREEVFSMLMQYRDSQREFEVRIVAVMLMSHFLVDIYIDEVINALNALHAHEYYAKMGIAWAVATIMAKYPDECLGYMRSKENKLDNWTYNKAIQKMKESYRVTDEMKKIVDGMKR